MCAGICKAPEDHAMTCEECQTGIMKSQEQLLNPKTIDYLVEQLTPLICASVDDERCPTVVDTVIRQGLPLLAAEGDTSEMPEVGSIFSLLFMIAHNFMLTRFATLLCRELALPGEPGSTENIKDDIS